MQFLKLYLINRGGGINHHISAAVVLREGDKVAYGLLSAKQRYQSVKAER